MDFKDLMNMMDIIQQECFQKNMGEDLKDILDMELKTIYAPNLDTKIYTYKTFFTIVKNNKVLYLYPNILTETNNIKFGLSNTYPFIYISIKKKSNSSSNVMIFDYDKEEFIQFFEVFGY